MKLFSRHLLATPALVCLIFTGTSLAQTGTAALYGTITDQQGGVLPGVTVTITNTTTAITRTTVSDGVGTYQILALPPGIYSIRLELEAFKTAVRDKVELPVDVRTRLDIPMELGARTETIEVHAVVSPLNTSDASLGNVISGNQVRALPLEARNVVGLLSLQPGAVYVPNAVSEDPRNGSVNGARADQSNVTLDGVDVNDPQFGTAYTSGLRVTLDALQEFRVTTSNYGADSGRSSSAQVSLVTRSGTNNMHGSGFYLGRQTDWSSGEYFLGLSGQKAELDKKIGGGALGGPIVKDKFFFFGNYERLNESSETPVVRAVPSDSMRDGVLIYGCADPSQCPATTVQGFTSSHAIAAGYYALTPDQLTAIDPLHHGPSKLVSDLFNKYPQSNDPGADGLNIVGYRFPSPRQNEFNTYIGRLDYRASPNQSFFGRFNLQWDNTIGTQQFPGQAPRTTQKVRSRGFAIGHDWVLSSNKINTLRYGFTDIIEDSIGQQTESRNSFLGIDDLDPLTPTFGRKTPTHNFVDDFNWIKGSHTLKVGANLRFTRVPRYDTSNSFNFAFANYGWIAGVGATYAPGGECPGTEDACGSVPAVGDDFEGIFASAFTPMLGILSQATLNANYLDDGTVLPLGQAVRRKYGSDEYEFYAQDSWKIRQNLTVTAGLRYSLFSPPWEVDGQQVAPDIDLGNLLQMRQANMLSGNPDNTIPTLTFDLAGPANGKPGFYDWDKNNFAPRLAAAWTPKADGGFLGWLTGGDKMVVRAGYSLVYDRIGQALATDFDRAGSFGLASIITSPVYANNEDNPDIRFQGINVLPPTLPAVPPGGFPATPRVGEAGDPAGTISSALDSSIKTPYAHSYNVVVGRELGGDFTIEAAYVGRQGRHLLMRRDLMMPLNFVDAKSGVDYFTAARQLIETARASGDPLSIAPIAYWENVFPDAAGAIFDDLNHSATQNMAEWFMENEPDWMTALYGADEYCFPACATTGPFTFFNRQFDSLAAQSSIARSGYNALQLSLRKRWSHGYQFDVNYTLAHAKDHGSAVEKGSAFGSTEFLGGGYSGFAVNTWDLDQQYADADFDVRHEINVNWITELPFGHGRPIGQNSPGWLNAVIGEWSVAGLWRWSSGFPFNVINAACCWATNWNVQGNASLVTPGVIPETATTRNAVKGLPSPFKDPAGALDFFRYDFPGESGLRNALRGDGYFTIDLSIAKGWSMPWSTNHKVRFRWDIFNLTNTPKFDVGKVTMSPDISTTFGSYNGSLASCDGGAGRCMQFAIRYEF